MSGVFMACGHTTHGVDSDGKPVCVACVGIVDGARTPAEPPKLEGRRMRCTYFAKCKHEQPSDVHAAFFESRPHQEFDGYYCGCWGWD